MKNGKPVKKALTGVSMEMNAGEVFGLLGVNGAGKTTLSSIIAGLHPPTAGDVKFRGVSIYEDATTYRENVGFCPQVPNLDKALTLEENLHFSGRCFGLSKADSKARTDELMTQFQLGSYAKSRVPYLSGGYKQRFLIARTLIHSLEIVILDEPTVGLDVHIRHGLWDLIEELKEDCVTVILTTHYLEEAEKLSDRVCFIHEGAVQAIDTPKKLMAHHKKGKLEDVFLKLMEEQNEA